MFRFGTHTLALTVCLRAQGAVVASLDEDEMLKIMKKVTNARCAELVGAVLYLLTALGAALHHLMLRCRLIRQM